MVSKIFKVSVENSVVNFVDEYCDERIYFKFLKIDKDTIQIHAAFPFSLFQAFALGITAFDYKM